MSDLDQPDDVEPGRTDHPSDGIETLLRATGRRPAVPTDRADRVEASVRAHWRSAVHDRSRRRRLRTAVALALAATVLIAVGLGIGRRIGSAPPPAATARVERVVAAAWSRPVSDGSTGAPVALQPGDEIPAGSELVTQDGGLLAVRMESGHSVRLDAGTRLRLVSEGVIALARGAIYVDSLGAQRAPNVGFQIRTPFGSIRDVGTQFEARLQTASLRLSVREGSIFLDRGDSSLEVSVGQELEVAEDGRAARQALTAFGPAWTWIGEVTPMLGLDGRSLREFLDWMARERGLTLEFASAGVARSASEIRLNGSIDTMTLAEALESVLSTCRMRGRITGSVLFVEPTDEPAQSS